MIKFEEIPYMVSVPVYVDVYVIADCEYVAKDEAKKRIERALVMINDIDDIDFSDRGIRVEDMR